MASLKLLYRQEATDGAPRAVGKTLQLGKGRGVVLVLCEGKGRMPQAAQAAQKALQTIEEQFTSSDQQINLSTTNVHASIVWINKDRVNTAGNGKVMCFNPQGGEHTFQDGLYNGDVILLAPTALFKALTPAQITKAIAANPTDLKAVYNDLLQVLEQAGEAPQTILLALVTAGAKIVPESRGAQTKQATRLGTKIWLIASAVLTIAIIILLCLF